MGIRDTRYYGWKTLLEYSSADSTVPSSSFYAAEINQSGNLCVVGSLSLFTNTYRSTNSIILKESQGKFQVVQNLSSSDGYLFCVTALSSSNKFFAPVSQGASSRFIYSGSSDLLQWGRAEVIEDEDWQRYVLGCDSSGSTLIFCGYLSYPGGAAQSWKVFISSQGGLTGTWADIDTGIDGTANDVAISPSNGSVIYVAGCNEVFELFSKKYTGQLPSLPSSAARWVVRRTTDRGANWSSVDSFVSGGAGATCVSITPSGDAIYVGGFTNFGGSTTNAFIRKSTNGTVWTTVFSGSGYDKVYDIGIDSNSNVYAVMENAATSSLFVSHDAGTTWNLLESKDLNVARYLSIKINRVDNSIYLLGNSQGKFGLVKKGKLTANSASIGPSFLGTSFGYVVSEISGNTVEKFNLNNVSEFPHSCGAFQMKNLIIGTTDSGRIGKDADSIIQVRHRGSFVKVLWPSQDVDSFVKGYGDFSQGQKSGKLTTTFTPGDFVDVREYDHLSLYCYLKKQVSGTLDDVVVRIERRPLGDIPFTVDQTVTYAESGSFAVEAELRDLIFKKTIDYGDLSISEIGYPIDVPLENTREIRISCRHKNGQVDDANKNFIVWGRFIDSEKET